MDMLGLQCCCYGSDVYVGKTGSFAAVHVAFVSIAAFWFVFQLLPLLFFGACCCGQYRHSRHEGFESFGCAS